MVGASDTRGLYAGDLCATGTLDGHIAIVIYYGDNHGKVIDKVIGCEAVGGPAGHVDPVRAKGRVLDNSKKAISGETVGGPAGEISCVHPADVKANLASAESPSYAANVSAKSSHSDKVE